MTWTHEGDMARSLERKLQSEHLQHISADGESFVDQIEIVQEQGKSIFDRISFRWRADEKAHLDRIRSSVDGMMGHMFAETKAIMDDFYRKLWVPEIDERTGMTVLDSSGAVVWKTDPVTGEPVENWKQMDGQDIEECLLRLTRSRIEVAVQSNELLMEAVFAKHIYDDRFQDAFSELIEETIPGRNAYASRQTRVDKYRSFFSYYLWSSVKTFKAEVDNFCRILERVRYWRIEEGSRGEKTSRF